MAQANTEYGGTAVKWGLHPAPKIKSAAACCQLCKSFKPPPFPCNAWVFCPDPSGQCWSSDTLNHTTGAQYRVQTYIVGLLSLDSWCAFSDPLNHMSGVEPHVRCAIQGWYLHRRFAILKYGQRPRAASCVRVLSPLPFRATRGFSAQTPPDSVGALTRWTTRQVRNTGFRLRR